MGSHRNKSVQPGSGAVHHRLWHLELRNATAPTPANATRWTFLDQGLEETVPLALISPPEGAHLLSGVGDIDGFRHDDLDQSPAEERSPAAFGNTEDLAFAGKKPQT